MKQKNSDLAAAIDEIEKDLLKTLKKSEDVEKRGDITAKAEGPEGEQMDDSAPAPEGVPADGPPPAPEAEAPEAPQEDAPPSMEELVQAYSQLSPDELQMHIQALEQVKQMSAPAPEATASASPGPGAQAPGANEGSAAVAPSSEMAMKSEKLGQELEGLKKSQAALVDALKALIGAPQRKGYTGADMVPAQPKPEQEVLKLSKAEINTRLKKKAAENLAKSDRDLIRSFYNNSATVADLAHLLK